MDATDRKLLSALQHNGAATAQELGMALNLSPSQAGRRKLSLEERGLITGYHARLDAEQLGLHVQAFVQVSLERHGAGHGDAFARLVRLRPEIVSCWTMTGEADYLIRVYCEDLPSLNRLIHDVLLAQPMVSRVQSQIVLDQLKADAPLPLA